MLNAETEKLVLEGTQKVRFGSGGDTCFVDFYSANNEFTRFAIDLRPSYQRLAVQRYANGALSTVYVISADK